MKGKPTSYLGTVLRLRYTAYISTSTYPRLVGAVGVAAEQSVQLCAGKPQEIPVSKGLTVRAPNSYDWMLHFWGRALDPTWLAGTHVCGDANSGELRLEAVER